MKNSTTLENAFGGTGITILESLLDDDQLNGKCGLFAQVTVTAGSSLGFHEHHGETETYYILSGEGVYDDNGKKLPAAAGDVFFCKDGDGHGLENTGASDLVFIALIILA